MRSVSSAPQEKLPPLHPADSVEPCVNDPLSWAQKKAKRGEDIEMSKFAEELGFHCEEDAHPLFMQVLQSTTVPYIIRRRSLNQYKVWKASKGGEFWADRRIRYQVRMSTKSAVSEIIEGSGAVREHYISVNNSTLIPLLSNNSRWVRNEARAYHHQHCRLRAVRSLISTTMKELSQELSTITNSCLAETKVMRVRYLDDLTVEL
ncbi:hypothetical protein BCR41DRAFT_353424 [Lobosporangium transversale]|uniref:Uncharacterized protein n=1 Tax=Lobosporangium transversale TaxID=64571 RepID=A0A1Y2GMU9_9FUNG|nr:hypothetical protein BCR41DRAFT_353424 [Lobosporangium transversale]ORZ16037.1 hypothetical protein BCR41DRAFT_353424 [Lobosporangium transversale]|eukprot:XP_021881384.1 hypothetical protein BCR41DRAFT_353424 [Lobosporangium transversale]